MPLIQYNFLKVSNAIYRMEMNIKLSLNRLGKTLRGGQPRLDGRAASAKRSEAAGQRTHGFTAFAVASVNIRLAGS